MHRAGRVNVNSILLTATPVSNESEDFHNND